jgi:hypothetical protein
MTRLLLALTLVVGVSAASAPSVAEAQYGYYGTFRGGGRNTSGSHVRSLASQGNVFIQSYAPPPGYGYYGEGYGQAYGYGPGYGYAPGYGPHYGHHHHRGYAPYGYGGYSSGPRW